MYRRLILLIVILATTLTASAQGCCGSDSCCCSKAKEATVQDPLWGKTICVIGDSYVRNHKRPFTETWHYKAAMRHGMNYRNYGRNGGCIAFDRTKRGFGKPIVERYAEMTDTADIVLVIAGHNDAYFVAEGPDSLTKFKDNLELLCNELRQKYPTAHIAFVSPWDVNEPGFKTVIKEVKKACKRHGFPFLNAAKTSGIKVNDEAFRKQYFQALNDHAHLNDAGHNLLVDWGEKFLLKVVNTPVKP